MKSQKLTLMFATLIFWFGAVTLTVAQQTSQTGKLKHRRYKLVDLGTLGGPASYGTSSGANAEGNQLLNDSGTIGFSADTNTPDPFAPVCFNSGCLVSHATRWKNGVLKDLGALPGNNSSTTDAINDLGWSAGFSEDGTIDPLFGVPVFKATFWDSKGIHGLGTLGGIWSIATGITDEGEIVGMATTEQTADPFVDAFLGPFPSPTHPFIWKGGTMIDLGTLGGPDAFVSGSGCGNQGLVVGNSLTSFAADPSVGIPPMRPFAWGGRKMIDLGTLGGEFGFAQCGNHRGQVIGTSSVAEHPFACFTGEPGCHPFLWERGVLKDLGTLGGDSGFPVWINDAGDVVGEAETAGNQAIHAFLWRHGVMTDLGTLGDKSHATAINSEGQVVGWFFVSGRTEPPFRHAFIWEKGDGMVDLNTLIPPNSGLELVTADNVNERGEIVGIGVPASCFPDSCGHLFLLIPCDIDERHNCADEEENTSDAIQSDPGQRTLNSTSTQVHQPMNRASAWRTQMANRYHHQTMRAPRE